MPRRYLPLLVRRPPVYKSFQLDKAAKRSIARTIDLKQLDSSTVESINRAVSCYRATQSGSTSTTVANTLLALNHLKKSGRAREEALRLLADDYAAVDYTTHDLLRPLAKDVLNGRPGADEALARAARERADELALHPRVSPSTEAMRLFCGIVRRIFNDCTPHLKGRITEEDAWYRCRRFALEVFGAAGIGHADFDAHPERLTEYLGTDVSVA
jgi:hypothetical protein